MSKHRGTLSLLVTVMVLYGPLHLRVVVVDVENDDDMVVGFEQGKPCIYGRVI